MQDKLVYQAELFANRLKKREAHLKKWARRNTVACYRLYDRDIPEIPLALDWYAFESGAVYGRLFLYERPYQKDEAEEAVWLAAMKAAASAVLGIPEANLLCKIRKRQRGSAQYEKAGADGIRGIVSVGDAASITGIIREQGLRFMVDLTSYLDTGIFLDHRLTRSLIRSRAEGKRALNLFCYTGAFSVYAASGGAAAVDSVDMSNTYLEIAQKNMALNGFGGRPEFLFHRSDVSAFLENAAGKKQWDIIILDPPTFSDSKKMTGVLDINAHWPRLIAQCLAVLAVPGLIFFSTNSKKLQFDASLLSAVPGPGQIRAEEITGQTIPEDFHGKPHRVWRICAGF
ncbi:MAG: class I SAM-dependent methyltransferase [Treponema sp.]|jgi:23S rRNA (cytosine1962-C5)-methyltransferase|nr:class I SAM-dependent methyltransferase [Treponema sp.]